MPVAPKPETKRAPGWVGAATVPGEDGLDELKLANQRLLLAALREQELFDQANDSLRLRDQVLAVVSHDLSTLALAIGLSAESMLAPAAGPLPARLTRSLQNIHLSAQQMAKLISDLLDLGKAQGGRLILDLAKDDVGRLVRGAVATLEPFAERKGLHLSVKIRGAPPPLLCDRHRLSRVLHNLISNAIKFTPEGGRIHIHVGSARGKLEVSVEDTGPGIDPADLPRLFHAFERGKRTRHVGNGLGLYIAREIIEAHGGTLEGNRAPGGGARLTFTLPLAGPDAMSARVGRTSPARGTQG